MTQVSNDPSFWPLINLWRISSYFMVVASTVVVYDWALTFGQEFELIWRQRWSLITVLYLGVRYVGVIYSCITISSSLPTVSVTDVVSAILYLAFSWMNYVTVTMLGVIMITRLYSMYQRSRKMLFFLAIIFFAVTIACGVFIGDMSGGVSGEELVLSGTYQCTNSFVGDVQSLITETWILVTVWEVLALSLAVWIVIRHFHELRRSSTGWTMRGCFAVLIRTHVLYFAAFGAVSCLTLSSLAAKIYDLPSIGAVVYNAILQLALLVQMFVLGPRLILSMREYYAKLVAASEEGADMTAIVFHERTQVLTSSDV